MSLVGDAESIYSSINSLNTSEGGDVLDEISDDADAITDNDEDKLICEIHMNADNYRLCKSKAAHNVVLGRMDVFLAKQALTAVEAPHLDKKALIAKLDHVA